MAVVFVVMDSLSDGGPINSQFFNVAAQVIPALVLAYFVEMRGVTGKLYEIRIEARNMRRTYVMRN